jgi:hypothetical protein
MGRVIRLLIVVTGIMIVSQPAVSQVRFGAFADVQWNIHNAEFQHLPGVRDDSTLFQGITSMGANIGAIAEYPIGENSAAQLRLGVSFMNATFNQTEFIGFTVQDTLLPVYVEHHLETQLTALTIAPSLTLHPLPFPLRMELGTELGLLLSNSYNQRQTMLTPGVKFTPDDSDTLHVGGGDLPDVGFLLFGLRAAIGYEVRLGDFKLLPELGFAFGATNVVRFDNNDSWKVHNIRFGMAVMFDPTEDCEIGPGPGLGL